MCAVTFLGAPFLPHITQGFVFCACSLYASLFRVTNDDDDDDEDDDDDVDDDVDDDNDDDNDDFRHLLL